MGRGGPRRGVRENKPPIQPLDPPKPLFEIARKGEVDASLRAPGLARPTLAPECRQRTESGQRLPLRGPAGRGAGNSTSPARAEREHTPEARARARAAGEVPLSSNFPGPGAAGRARCASPGPREPKLLRRRLPGSPGPARRASPVWPWVGALHRGEKRAGAGRRGGRGRGGRRAERGHRPCSAAAAPAVPHQSKAPAPLPPAPVAGRPAWDEGLFVSKLL